METINKCFRADVSQDMLYNSNLGYIGKKADYKQLQKLLKYRNFDPEMETSNKSFWAGRFQDMLYNSTMEPIGKKAEYK